MVNIRLSVLAAAAAAIAGCQAQQKSAAPGVSPQVLDVAPTPVAQQPAVYAMPAYTPATSTTPAPAYLPPPADPADVPPSNIAQADPAPQYVADRHRPHAARYIVKRGDTLYHIAKERYGDGKQWRRIAAANPGVSPASLKVGQKLVMP